MTIEKRYDFVFLFDVQDGNPNGDPDAGNLPRIDPQTGEGLVTDVCLKRKVRNFIQMTQNGEHYDIRTFGAVMTTGKNAGQVRGPVQLTFSRSIDPIMTLEHSITRMAVTNEKDASETGDNRTMGRKFTVPYGLYRCHGFVSAHFAKQTGFSENDLELFWQALVNMFDHDHSAARGQMNARGLYVFEHSNNLGDTPADSLFKRIQVVKKDGVEVARSFDDYLVIVDDQNLGKTKLLRKLG